MKEWSWRWGLLAGLALLIYWPALHAGFIWDDDAYVTANTALGSLRGLWEIWAQPGRLDQYYPLTYSSFWLEHQLWGFRPFGYHLVNVLLHSLNALLVWKLLERLKIRGAWFACMLFLFHPVIVESVAWISERKNVLSGVFYLLAFLAYLHYKERTPRARHWYVASLLLFLAALCSKTVTATLPAAIILVLWWKEGRFPWKELLRLVPFLLAGMALSSITVRLENGHISHEEIGNWTFTFTERCIIAGRAFWFYLGKLLWPHPLVFIYPRWTLTVTHFWPYRALAAFLLLPAFLWKLRTRWGQGPFTAFMIFTVTLFPALGFKSFFPMLYSFVADHFQYLASIALFALAASVMTLLIKNRPLRVCLGITVLITLAILSFKQCYIYKDLETLWRDTLAKNPQAWMAHNNLAVVLEETHDLKSADAHYLESVRLRNALVEAHYRESIRIQPNNIIAYNNLVKLLIESRRFKEAEDLIKESPKTNTAGNYNNLGALLTQKGDLANAANCFRQAVSLEPDSATTQNNLGAILFKLGKTEEAIEHHKKALEIKPDFPGALLNLGNAYLKAGKTEEAVRCYRQSIKLDRQLADSYVNLGFALSLLGRFDETMGLYQYALDLKPDHPLAHNSLAHFLVRQKQFDKADLHFREAIRFQPGAVPFRLDYASFLLGRGKTQEARNQYLEILKIDPKNITAVEALGRLDRKRP